VGSALGGINAAVVGVLLAALYRPVIVSAIHSWMDLLIAVGAGLLLSVWKLPSIIVIAVCLAAVLLA